MFFRSISVGLILLAASALGVSAEPLRQGRVCLTTVCDDRDVSLRDVGKGSGVGNLDLYVRSPAATQLLVMVVDNARKPLSTFPPRLLTMQAGQTEILPIAHKSGTECKVYALFFAAGDKDVATARQLVDACVASPTDSGPPKRLLLKIGDWSRPSRPELAHSGATPTQTGGMQVMTAGSANPAPVMREPSEASVPSMPGGGKAAPSPPARLKDWEKVSDRVQYGPDRKGLAVYHLKRERR